jgi:hypothetical protein
MLDLTITDDNDELVEGARVTLLMGNDVIFTTGLTDANGEITLNWEAVATGTMSIMAMKPNYRPYESSIEISDSFGAAISIIPNIIYANSGEETEFEIELHNYGTLIAEDVIVELSSSSDHVTIDQGVANYGSIPSGSSISRHITVYIHGTAFDMEDMEFQLTISDSRGNNWANHVPVVISGAHLIITDYSGDTNPGSLTAFSISLENEGSTSANDIMVELLPYDNYVTVNSGLSLINNLPVGEFAILNDFELSFSQDIINGTILPLEILLTSSDGYTRSHIVNVTIGEVRETDPLGPDAYGYYIYDSGDTDYEFAPVYDWIEIAEGLGNQLSMSDNGNGNYTNSYTNSSELIDLPFIFTFYGVDYDQIVVNTNGWISFGHFKMYSFRNYPIPGAGGPSPMVAAFWDDLKTGSSGYVHHYETDEMVVIQWDYMRTYPNSDRETFEIILYNKEYTTPTNTGDSEIKIQYQDFNNTSDGNYTNYTPTHGCYSTIGIENHLGDIGLEYTFNNSYPEAAATLQDGSAIFITTRTESSYILGDLNDDGIVNILDVVLLVNIVLGNEDFNPAGDMNTDGLINVLDVVILVNAILS